MVDFHFIVEFHLLQLPNPLYLKFEHFHPLQSQSPKIPKIILLESSSLLQKKIANVYAYVTVQPNSLYYSYPNYSFYYLSTSILLNLTEFSFYHLWYSISSKNSARGNCIPILQDSRTFPAVCNRKAIVEGHVIRPCESTTS